MNGEPLNFRTDIAEGALAMAAALERIADSLASIDQTFTLTEERKARREQARLDVMRARHAAAILPPGR